MRVIANSLILSVLVLAAASPARAQAPENEAMAQRVAQTLKESGRLKNYRVGVKYQEGVAWLLGTVTSQQQSEIAEALAAETEGVTQVVNRLEIAGAEAPNIAPEISLTAAPALRDAPVSAHMASNMMEQPAAGHLGPEPRPIAMPQNAHPAPAQVAGLPGGHHLGHGYPGPHPAPGMAHPMAGPAVSAGGPVPMGYSPQGMARQVSHDHPAMPGYAWPSYAAYPNYAALTYPQQYSAAAWPYIGPFYPYPQVPLGWRKVTLEWDDGWWFLDFCE